MLHIKSNRANTILALQPIGSPGQEEWSFAESYEAFTLVLY